MSDTEKNLSIIKELQSAFTKGDIPTVLAHLAEDVDWQSPVTWAKPKEITWSKPRQNRREVESFFKELYRKVRYDKLEAVSFTAHGDQVVVEGTAYGTVVPTVSPFRSDFVMAFTVKEGKVIRFRHYYDSADLIAAFHPRGREGFAGKPRLKFVKLF